MTRPYFSFVMLVFLALAPGCGSDDPFGYVQVNGTITYDDGTPIPADSLRVTFVPQEASLDAKTHARPGVAEVNVTDGSFSVVTSRKHGDGIVPGRHKVTVVALDASQAPTRAVPVEYQSESTTPLSVDTGQLPFQLLVTRP
jgi:hypothetical protein